MIEKSKLTIDNFGPERAAVAINREVMGAEEQVLDDVRILREFALENDMIDEVVELYFEEAFVWQHKLMMSKESSDLKEMKSVVQEAAQFIEKHNLDRWTSRVSRFLGRISDYEGNFADSISYYQSAIDLAPLDPKYSENEAIVLEYRGFKVLCEVRTTDNLGQSIDQVLNLYLSYNTSSEGLELKKRDYTTWAIWRTGLLINLSNALIDMNKHSSYITAIEHWLAMAQSNFEVPEGISVWSDFAIRKNEIAMVRERV